MRKVGRQIAHLILQDITALARGQAHQEARLELEGRAKRWSERAALIRGSARAAGRFGCAASVSQGFKLCDVAPIRLPGRRRALPRPGLVGSAALLAEIKAGPWVRSRLASRQA
jgi:hypothetical protein